MKMPISFYMGTFCQLEGFRAGRRKGRSKLPDYTFLLKDLDCLRVHVFPVSAPSTNGRSAKPKDQYLEEKERFSLSTSMVPTLPAYGYTSKGLQLADGSNAGVVEPFSTEDDWEEQTLCASSPTPVRKAGIVGLPQC